MKSRSKTEFVAAEAHAALSTGEVLRMLRELKGWTQKELAKRSKISETNISLLENDGLSSLPRRLASTPPLLCFRSMKQRQFRKPP